MKHEVLEKFFTCYKSDKDIQALNDLEKCKVYEKAITLAEKDIWKETTGKSALPDYQALFREYEEHLENSDLNKSRFKFIITIPVADRPQHLNTCLQSILRLCKIYQYGGIKETKYHKVCVLISDDSQLNTNIEKNQQITDSFKQQGLECIYFGAEQQQKLISIYDKKHIKNIIGDIDPDNFFHKGASITRNISYLKLLQLQNENEPCLFYFIDSDQEFKINTTLAQGSENSYSINYFYQLNKIFSQKGISILTGKVVGDPPVSPAVMAGTFLDDVINFCQQISALKAEHKCTFHSHIKPAENDAAYHDMADLFGFKPSNDSYEYQCSLKHQHKHIECFNRFAEKLNQFFDGEHPTRKSYYQHEDINSSIKPARTIYTGNYIFKPENLKYFIPFANLKLRMAGPVLGRIIQSELGTSFVSANLPMLHNRTVDSLGQSEFRSGVNHLLQSIDLSGEFIRQFYGDVMLFSIIELTKSGYPKKHVTFEKITETVHKNFSSMKLRYIEKQQHISNKIIQLKTIIHKPENWWNSAKSSEYAINLFNQFIENIENNFGKNALTYTLINSEKDIDLNLNKISCAIKTYHADRSHWQNLLSNGTSKS